MENTVLDTRAEHLNLLEENIREAMRHRSLDPHEDQHAVRGLIDEHLNDSNSDVPAFLCPIWVTVNP